MIAHAARRALDAPPSRAAAVRIGADGSGFRAGGDYAEEDAVCRRNDLSLQDVLRPMTPTDRMPASRYTGTIYQASGILRVAQKRRVRELNLALLSYVCAVAILAFVVLVGSIVQELSAFRVAVME